MNLDLLIALKDAGFLNPYTDPAGDHYIAKDGLYVPSLSELIEACGRGFQRMDRHNLVANPDTFWAYSKKVEALGEDSPFGKGNTPEEAVARLWLALNKK